MDFRFSLLFNPSYLFKRLSSIDSYHELNKRFRDLYVFACENIIRRRWKRSRSLQHYLLRILSLSGHLIGRNWIELIHLELGKALRSSGKMSLALVEFRKIESAAAHLEAGTVYYMLEDHERAIREFRKAIDCEPGNDEAYVKLGTVYISDMGIEPYIKMLQEFSAAEQELWALLELAHIYRISGNYGEAGAQLERLASYAGYSGLALMEMAVLRYTEGKYGESENILSAILVDAPDRPSALALLGRVYSAMGRYGEALKLYCRVAGSGYAALGQRFEIFADLHTLGKKLSRNRAYKELKKALLGKIFDEPPVNRYLDTLCRIFGYEVNAEIKEYTLDFIINAGGQWRYPLINLREGLILYLLVRLCRPEVVLETGTFMGMSASYMAAGCRDNAMGKIHTVDRDNFSGFAMDEELKKWVVFYRGWDIVEVLPGLCENLHGIDLFFHDSNHSYEHFIWEMKTVHPFMRKGGFFIAHDVSCRTGDNERVGDFFNRKDREMKKYFFTDGADLGLIVASENLVVS